MIFLAITGWVLFIISCIFYYHDMEIYKEQIEELEQNTVRFDRSNEK